MELGFGIGEDVVGAGYEDVEAGEQEDTHDQGSDEASYDDDGEGSL